MVRVVLPPLRARREDIPALVTELMRRRGLAAGRVAGPNLDRLMAHSFPGNLRELRNLIDRAIALSPGATSFADLRLQIAPQAAAEEGVAVRSDSPYAEAKAAVLHTFELRYLRDLKERHGGNISAAARAAELTASTCEPSCANTDWSRAKMPAGTTATTGQARTRRD